MQLTKREETRLEKQLTEEIRILENNINANNVTLLEEKKAELQAIRNSRLEGVIVRSRVKWLQDGEKASRYFCNLVIIQVNQCVLFNEIMVTWFLIKRKL